MVTSGKLNCLPLTFDQSPNCSLCDVRVKDIRSIVLYDYNNIICGIGDSKKILVMYYRSMVLIYVNQSNDFDKIIVGRRILKFVVWILRLYWLNMLRITFSKDRECDRNTHTVESHG